MKHSKEQAKQIEIYWNNWRHERMNIRFNRCFVFRCFRFIGAEATNWNAKQITPNCGFVFEKPWIDVTLTFS